jgi:F0F1-type ATP synthase assembly protein I
MLDPKDPQLARSARYIALGAEFGVSVVAGVVLGYYLDEWLGTAPLFLLLLSLGAFAASVYRMVKTLQSLK